MKKELLLQTIRDAEGALMGIHSEKQAFSEHLFKWTDTKTRDKYDNNGFDFSPEVSGAEILSALKYQQANGDSFLKLQGRTPLKKELVEAFKLEEVETLTMVLEGNASFWNINTAISIVDYKDEDISSDIIELELADFKESYGEDFCRRNIENSLRESVNNPDFHYLAAYLGEKAVAACYIWCCKGTVGLDGLHTHSDYRGQYIATTLMAEIVKRFPGYHYLHAYEDDTPKEMYERMGYKVQDSLYEYLLKW